MLRNGGCVLVADGDGNARANVVRALQRAGYETLEVDSASSALEAVRGDGIDLLLLEVALPDMTGYEVCHAIREERGEDLPIFFMSGTRTDSLDRVAGLLLGADDFIIKPFDPAELVARVRRFIKRLGSSVEDAAGPRLTPREREILELLAEGKRQKEIAKQLSVSPKTVATHIQNMLAKHGVHSRAELVALAYRIGQVRSVSKVGAH